MKENTINDIQKNIVEEFSLLDGDREMKMLYIMDLGQKLPAMDVALKTEDNLIKGCQSKVWISASIEQGKIFFQADSNTSITKGLISLLVRIFSNQTPNSIIHAHINFVEHIKMNQFIGTQRSSGFNAMIKQIKLYALAFKSHSQHHNHE